ncbi:MAG: phosphoenolpyruvate hydrolase family protein [Nitrospira sp.]
MRRWLTNLSKPILFAGVGSGLTATAAAAGGADALAVYSTATYRIRGAPTALSFLPYEHCNDVAFSTLRDVRGALSQSRAPPPIFLGLGAHDPRVELRELLSTAKTCGADGISNEPFVSIYGQDISAALERAGLGFGREVELLTLAKERGFLTFGWAFSPEQAATLVAAGADFIGAMAGISTNTVPLDSFADEIQRLGEISDTAKRCRTSCLVLGHGGPFTTASAIGELLTQTSLDGFATGSNIERDVVHLAVKNAVASLKQDLA